VLISFTAERLHVHRLTYTEDVIFMFRRHLREIMLQKFTGRLTIIIIIIIITSHVFYKYPVYALTLFPFFRSTKSTNFPSKNFMAINLN